VSGSHRLIRITAAVATSAILAFLLATGGGGGGGGGGPQYPPYAAQSQLRNFQTFFNDVDFRSYQRIEMWQLTTQDLLVDNTRVFPDVFENGTDNEGLICAGNRIYPPIYQWQQFEFTTPVTVSNSPRTFVAYYGQSYNKNPNGYASTYKMSDVHEVNGAQACGPYTVDGTVYNTLLPGVQSKSLHGLTYWLHVYCEAPPC